MLHPKRFQSFLRDMSGQFCNISGQSSLNINSWIKSVFIVSFLTCCDLIRCSDKIYKCLRSMSILNTVWGYYFPHSEATSCCWGTRLPRKDVWWVPAPWTCTKLLLPLLPSPSQTCTNQQPFLYVYPVKCITDKKYHDDVIKCDVTLLFKHIIFCNIAMLSPRACNVHPLCQLWVWER